jgi:hypothetical protein
VAPVRPRLRRRWTPTRSSRSTAPIGARELQDLVRQREAPDACYRSDAEVGRFGQGVADTGRPGAGAGATSLFSGGRSGPTECGRVARSLGPASTLRPSCTSSSAVSAWRSRGNSRAPRRRCGAGIASISRATAGSKFGVGGVQPVDPVHQHLCLGVLRDLVLAELFTVGQSRLRGRVGGTFSSATECRTSSAITTSGQPLAVPPALPAPAASSANIGLDHAGGRPPGRR